LDFKIFCLTPTPLPSPSRSRYGEARRGRGAKEKHIGFKSLPLRGRDLGRGKKVEVEN